MAQKCTGHLTPLTPWWHSICEHLGFYHPYRFIVCIWGPLLCSIALPWTLMLCGELYTLKVLSSSFVKVELFAKGADITFYVFTIVSSSTHIYIACLSPYHVKKMWVFLRPVIILFEMFLICVEKQSYSCSWSNLLVKSRLFSLYFLVQ